MCMLLEDVLTASEQSDDTLPASPAKTSKRIKAYSAIPMAEPNQALMAPTAPAYPKASMATLQPRSLTSTKA